MPAVIFATFYWTICLKRMTAAKLSVNINKIATSVYPNPFKDRITINFSELVPGEMTVDLYNMFGVITHKYRVKDSPLTMSYDFGELPSGSYVLQIKAPNYLFTKTLIKQ